MRYTQGRARLGRVAIVRRIVRVENERRMDLPPKSAPEREHHISRRNPVFLLSFCCGGSLMNPSLAFEGVGATADVARGH